MAKVVYKTLSVSKPSRKSASAMTKRVTDAEGKTMVVYTVNADSRTFEDDLSYAFRQNVKKARRENKKLLGSAGRVPAKD